jgi:hypothetical protein
VPFPTETDGICGTDILEKTGADINFDIGKLSLDGMNKAPYVCDNISTNQAPLAVFPSDMPENDKIFQTYKEEPKVSRPRLDSHSLDESPRYSKAWLVKTAQDIYIALRCRHVVTAKLNVKKGKEIPSLVCIGTATIPIQGVLSARAVTRVETSERDKTQPTSPSKQADTDASAKKVYVRLATFSQEELTLPKATFLGLVEKVPETLINLINVGKSQDMESPNRPQRKTRNEALYNKLLSEK